MAGNKSDVQGLFLKENDIPGASLVKEPSECSVEELMRWLECYRQKKSGKKDELVERVNGLFKLNVKVDPKADGEHWYNVKSNMNKQNNDATNFLIPWVRWPMFPSQDILVSFNYGHVYHYIIESVNKLFLPNSGTLDQDENLDDNIDDEDTVTAKPLRKGHWLVRSDFLKICWIVEQMKIIFYVAMFTIP